MEAPVILSLVFLHTGESETCMHKHAPPVFDVQSNICKNGTLTTINPTANWWIEHLLLGWSSKTGGPPRPDQTRSTQSRPGQCQLNDKRWVQVPLRGICIHSVLHVLYRGWLIFPWIFACDTEVSWGKLFAQQHSVGMTMTSHNPCYWSLHQLQIRKGWWETSQRSRSHSFQVIPELRCKSLHACAVKLQKATDEIPLVSSDQSSAGGAQPGY